MKAARSKDLAVPLFARMPDGIYREMVLERLARHVGMPAAALKKRIMAAAQTARPAGIRSFPATEETSPQLHGRMADGHSAAVAGPRPGVHRPRFRRPRSAGRGNLLSQAITLVVHHPAGALGAATRKRSAASTGRVCPC